MSRDRRGDRTQEVVGSIPISSTKRNQQFSATSRSRFLVKPFSGCLDPFSIDLQSPRPILLT